MFVLGIFRHEGKNIREISSNDSVMKKVSRPGNQYWGEEGAGGFYL